MYEYGEPQWNDIDRENQRTSRNACLSSTLSNTNLTWTDLGVNLSFIHACIHTYIHTYSGERPLTNLLSHGMAVENVTSSLFHVFILNSTTLCMVKLEVQVRPVTEI
jgi:hypothetical protein